LQGLWPAWQLDPEPACHFVVEKKISFLVFARGHHVLQRQRMQQTSHALTSGNLVFQVPVSFFIRFSKKGHRPPESASSPGYMHSHADKENITMGGYHVHPVSGG